MSLETVKTHLARYDKTGAVIEFETSTATVELAAAALGIEPARIAKSLSFLREGHALIVVAAGDVRVDNKKFKDTFAVKAKMLTSEQVAALTGHIVGGVCPFALPDSAELYFDISMRRFTTMFPACGTPHTAIELTLAELENITQNRDWVDVCKLPDATPEHASN